MGTFFQGLSSSVGRKYVMALTGLAMLGFLVMHLAGNLLLILPQGEKFNLYAENLASFGVLLYAAEFGLLLILIIHVINAIQLTLLSSQARPVAYQSFKSKGGPTKMNAASRSMIYSGAILFLFLILHILHFKFGPGIDDDYSAKTEEGTVRDLYRLVHESFKNPYIVVAYISSLVVLASHLRHGTWSLFQSLGLAFPRITVPLYRVALLFSLALSLGFILIPLWIYFDLGGGK